MDKSVDYRGSDIVIDAVSRAGITLCMANPGTTEMWFVKSLAKCANIKSVLGLHETVCSGACDGYARMTRKPALCLLHMGPGLANALSNLHNAKRARSPIVVLVGDMAKWHASSDAPLCMDIKSLAETVSASVVIPSSLEDMQTATVKATKNAIMYAAEPLQSRVSALIVPHDLTWQEASNKEGFDEELEPRRPPELSGEPLEFVEKCIARIQSTARGKLAFLIGGQASLDDANAIRQLGQVASKTKAMLYCENSFARVDRGFGRPHLNRLPYFPQDALRELKQYSLIVTFDCRIPVAQFGYEDGTSEIITLEEEDVWQLDSGDLSPLVIDHLHRRLEAESVIPGRNCGGLFPAEARPMMPQDGKLSPASLCSVIAHHQPESAVIVDESITSGGPYWDLSKGCPPFTHLTLTGGAIGCGPALALGAALARPDRRVINLQADGSAMYSLQAFWTQAKEVLNIVTVICSNRTYAILKIEVGKQGIRGLQGQELGTLTDISQPEINWVQLAEGMGISAVRVSTVNEFSIQFSRALASTGPVLIEALL